MGIYPTLHPTPKGVMTVGGVEVVTSRQPVQFHCSTIETRQLRSRQTGAFSDGRIKGGMRGKSKRASFEGGQWPEVNVQTTPSLVPPGWPCRRNALL